MEDLLRKTSPRLVIVDLLLCDGEDQQNVVFHHLINELAERWILLKRKNDNNVNSECIVEMTHTLKEKCSKKRHNS